MTAAYIRILFHAVNAFLFSGVIPDTTAWAGPPPPPRVSPSICCSMPASQLHSSPRSSRCSGSDRSINISGTAVILLMTRARRDGESGAGQRGGASNSLSKTFRLQFALLLHTRLCSVAISVADDLLHCHWSGHHRHGFWGCLLSQHYFTFTPAKPLLPSRF